MTTSSIDAAAGHAELRDKLWGAVLAGDEYAAAAIIFAALEAGSAPEELLLDVIAPVQSKVGTEWAACRITVAQEHAATAVNDRVIAALAHHPASRRTPSAGRLVVACVDGEWHALPARLLAEVLRLRGWQVDFLGAQVPTPHLVAHVHQYGPDAVALSCSIPTRLPTAHSAIAACHAAGVPVLVGGAGFGSDGRYAHLLGADAWAPDARAAERQLRQGFTRGKPVMGQPHDDLPHLTDQEYTMVTKTAAALVTTTMATLDDRFPAMRAYTDAQRQHTAQDIAYIVDFLAAGLYTDDPDLFTGFIAWTGDVLSARGVPAPSLHPALESLATQLQDFPRARRMLETAHRAIDGAPSAPVVSA